MGLGVLIDEKQEAYLGNNNFSANNFFVIFYFNQPGIQLVAEGEITIYRTLAAATKGEGLIVSRAKKGERFLILNCYDKKSFFVLEIKMSDGKKGFVGDGEFRMSGIPDCS